MFARLLREAADPEAAEPAEPAEDSARAGVGGRTHMWHPHRARQPTNRNSGVPPCGGGRRIREEAGAAVRTEGPMKMADFSIDFSEVLLGKHVQYNRECLLHVTRLWFG